MNSPPLSHPNWSRITVRSRVRRGPPRILRLTLRPEIEFESAAVPQVPSPAAGFRQRLLLPLAFTGGLASLGIEFAAARLLAPGGTLRAAILSGGLLCVAGEDQVIDGLAEHLVIGKPLRGSAV